MLKKSLVAVLALAVALAFSPMVSVTAAPLLGGTSATSESVVELAQAKKKAVKKKAKKAKKGKKKGKKGKKSSKAGKCGAFMYYSKGKCADARNKK